MPAFPDTRLRRAGISATRTAQLQTAYNAMDVWQQQRFRAIVASAPDEVLRRTYDPAGLPDDSALTPAQLAGDPAVLASVQAAILAAHDTDAERETFTPTRLSAASLRAAYVAATGTGALPAGLGWDGATYPITPTLSDTPGAGVVGSVGVTPEALFDAKSTARTAPGATFYVSPTGVNTNTGTSSGAAFRSLYKAIEAANAARVPSRIVIAAGIYERSNSFYFTSVAPTVDVALVATGGRVVTGTFDLFTASTRDATNTRCFTVAVANCDRVLDTGVANELGNHREMVNVADAAACNATPNSWSLVSGTLYIHRGDEAAITTTNTRVYRNQPQNFMVQTAINLYMGGDGTGSGFDLEGSPGTGVALLTMGAGAATAAKKVAVLANSTFKYGGGVIGTATVGLAVSGWNGLVVAFNCQADANATDGFNGHDPYTVPSPLLLTVNCSAVDNGRGASQSCNGWTIHEDMVAVDVGGLYRRNRGGTVRDINASRAYLFGTTVADDLGDVRMGGSIPPTAIRADDTATIWCDRVKVVMPRGQMAYTTGTSTATIHRRSCAPVAQPDYGPGVIDTY